MKSTTTRKGFLAAVAGAVVSPAVAAKAGPLAVTNEPELMRVARLSAAVFKPGDPCYDVLRTTHFALLRIAPDFTAPAWVVEEWRKSDQLDEERRAKERAEEEAEERAALLES